MADLPPPSAPPAVVSAALTTTQVQVTSDFRGARIVLYGAVFDPLDRPSDVVVVVRGPEQPIRIARKMKKGPIWINSRPVVFQGAPGFYMTASTRPLDRIAAASVLQRLGAGVDHLAFSVPPGGGFDTRFGSHDAVVSGQGADYGEWRQAVVRLKSRAGLYAAADHGVSYVDQNLFRAEIVLPTAAPIGTYSAEILLFQGGQAVSRRMRGLTVEKVGIERGLYVFAHKRPWLFGLLSVFIALGAGWLASVIFRRN